MVVARNQNAASYLCREWRERDSVQKIYLAYVKHWPPFHQHQLEEGTIDLPLAPSRTERIKWEVRPVEDGGKASLTFWKIHRVDEKVDANGDEEITSNEAKSHSVKKSGVTLELHPLTGRTHQLRIHCAAIGSGIDGDSLYGDSPIEWLEGKNRGTDAQAELVTTKPQTLRLHAHKLTFQHPSTGSKVTFTSLKPW